ncbi:hypothetical protein PI124_g19052 [Phytophthora idaei]|nr:hypothetical protein PI125_g18529 [Phytophthora idaei]KAG3134998.1 hypothetical protein PI126_g18442 [Phytophthora idaei]KAG3235926.1 hypothetical protein PI124_g19052 [Phytophthora idaei]
MLKEETSQDVAYSDDEFDSEHAYVGGDDEIAHENTEQEAAKQGSPVEADTEDAEQYDREFDDDDRAEPGVGSQTLETDNTLVNQTPPDTDAITEAPQEDAEAYDGEFDEGNHPSVAVESPPLETGQTLHVAEYTSTDADAILHDDEIYDGEFDNDDPVVPDAAPPTVDNYDTTMEQTPTAIDSIAAVSQDNKETEEVQLSHYQTESEDSEAEYSNDLENDELPKNTNTLSRNSSEDNLTQRRSSGASSAIARLTEDTSPKAGSMSIVLAATPLDKSTDTKEAMDATQNQEADDYDSDDQDNHATDDEANLENAERLNNRPSSTKPAASLTSPSTNEATRNEHNPNNSVSNTSQFEGDEKSGDEVCDYDVDELNGDRRRETETLLQEARTLLELQQNEIHTDNLAFQPQEVRATDMVVQPRNNADDIPGEADTCEGENNENGAEKYASPYEDIDEFADADADSEALNQETPQQEIAEGGEIEDQATIASLTEVAQAPEISQSVELPSASIAVKQDAKEAFTNFNPEKSPKPSQPENKNQPIRPKQPVKNGEPPAKQPSRPSTKKAPPPASSLLITSATDNKAISTPRSSRSKLKTVTSAPNPAACVSSATKSNSHESTTPNPSQGSPPKKDSSPRSPSRAHSGPNDDLPRPRKEPLPKQKVNSKPSTSGDHAARRRLLQPVRTPANLRFDLPKMDKTKRDWLFVNMFRHGDDLSKYEAFVPPTLLAKPPTAKETKKRPLSARQMYGNPYSSRFESSGRKLVPQPNPELQDRERNWVATTPHDSKLPTYDSILDKYCTRVTCPEVQRQIYQTRHRDLSPQLAFVLEKRVEKHYRKGFYDSFGGVSSYKTEIVPTPPSDSMRQLHMSPHSSTKSGLLKRQAISSVALEEEEEELLSAS